MLTPPISSLSSPPRNASPTELILGALDAQPTREAKGFYQADLVDDLEDHVVSAPVGAGERFLEKRMTTTAKTHIAHKAPGLMPDTPAELTANMGAYAATFSDPSMGMLGRVFGGGHGGAPSGYVKTSTEFDNPLVTGKLINFIPNAPDCTVRPQTVLQVKKMRKSAMDLNNAVAVEVSRAEWQFFEGHYSQTLIVFFTSPFSH